MKSLLLAVAIMLTSSAWATTPPTTATVFSNIDDRTNLDNLTTGWGWCTGSCAGGAKPHKYWMARNQTTPSLDGQSTEFYVNGKAWTNVLFWYNVGKYDSFTNFQTSFWVQIDPNSTVIGQALEFDTYQFVNGQEYMFGTQCDYSKGYVWDIWSQGQGHWIPTNVPCDLNAPAPLTPNVWYHITWSFHRTSDGLEHYDDLTVVRYDSTMNIVSNLTYNFNVAETSGPLPAGWNDVVGVQFQMDLNGKAGMGSNPTTLTEHVDQVTLTAW